MDRLVIQGGVPLQGRVAISGAKNAALPCIAAALLASGPVTLRHLPAVSDIRTMLKVLQALGCTAETGRDDDYELSAVIGAEGVAEAGLRAPYDLVKTMRASILVLGPLLARYGKASVSLPGGCAIGARPVNLHLEALERMGAVIEIDKGYVEAVVPAGRLRAIDHTFEKVSVGATENILMAATLAEGTSVLRNAAQEPEIGDLARMLTAMGAQIEGIDSPTLTVHGLESLGGCEHAVIPDRIEAGTFLCAVAAACGDVLLERVEPDQIRSIIDLLERCGCVFTEREGQTGRNLRIQREAGQKLRAKDVTTTPYPGFPTDLQAQVMAVMTQATGISVIRETIVDRIYHLDRGYSGLEQKLKALGARIERVGGGKV